MTPPTSAPASQPRHNGNAHEPAEAGAQAQVSRFEGTSGVVEIHITVCPTVYADFASQLASVERAYHDALAAEGITPGTAILRRFFCSDLANQAELLDARPFSRPGHQHDPCAVSRIGMAPAPPAKVSLWAYHVHDPSGPLHKQSEDHTLVCRRGGLFHCWTTGLSSPDGGAAYDQTRAVLDRYGAELRRHGLSWESNVIRTWLFVRDIDANYQGVVAARREIFHDNGLTPQTHFIASTGIGGGGVHSRSVLAFDAYAIRGLRHGQVTFPSAPDHLKPPHLYGVTFERAAAVDYADRRHVFISGTASIDPQGQIVHPGAVVRQVDRALDNVAALLGAAGAALDDLGILIAYIRDPADHQSVRDRLQERCGLVPFEVLVAPICRPGWLVEVEGVAAIHAHRPHFPPF
jgi:enamine deaminase RidA (YjgF/YER057c/UK114 family)